MINFVKKGGVIEYINSGGTPILSGSVVVIGGLIGIAVTTIAVGDSGSVNLEGVYELPLNGAIPAIGTVLYWDATNTRCDVLATVGPFIGNSASTVADLAGGVRVLLAGEGRPTSSLVTQQPVIAAIATADGSDAGTTQTLANATKAKVNAILAALKLAGIIASV